MSDIGPNSLGLDTTSRHQFPPIMLRPEEGEDVFKRIEDKYILSKSQAKFIIDEIERHMPLSYREENTQFTLVKSTYFDSPELDFFQQHFDKSIPARYKLRVREYAPNGRWESSAQRMHLVELKRKKLGVTKKTRFAINDSQWNEMATATSEKSFIVSKEELLTNNPKLSCENLYKRFSKISKLIEQWQLRPICSIQYRRYAYEKDHFRVTIDGDLQVQFLQSFTSVDGYIFKTDLIKKIAEQDFWSPAQELLHKYKREEKMVLELKHSGEIPAWMQSILLNLGPEQTSFSKYCYFLTQEIHRQYKNMEDEEVL